MVASLRFARWAINRQDQIEKLHEPLPSQLLVQQTEKQSGPAAERDVLTKQRAHWNSIALNSGLVDVRMQAQNRVLELDKKLMALDDLR